MMPMVFCASLVPWLKLIQDALSNWHRPNTTFDKMRTPVSQQHHEQRHEDEPDDNAASGRKEHRPNDLWPKPFQLGAWPDSSPTI